MGGALGGLGGDNGRYSSAATHLLYSAPRNKFRGFRHTLHSVREGEGEREREREREREYVSAMVCTLLQTAANFVLLYFYTFAYFYHLSYCYLCFMLSYCYLCLCFMSSLFFIIFFYYAPWLG